MSDIKNDIEQAAFPEWGVDEEEVFSIEEQESAARFALWMDEGKDEELSFLSESEEELKALASMGLLLRHSIAPPSLSEESKARIAEELWEDLGCMIAQENVDLKARSISRESDNPHWFLELTAWLQGFSVRPALMVSATFIVLLASWSGYKFAISPSIDQTSTSSIAWDSGHSNKRLFESSFESPSTKSPFLAKRSASERLSVICRKMGRWQRDRWISRLGSRRLLNAKF